MVNTELLMLVKYPDYEYVSTQLRAVI